MIYLFQTLDSNPKRNQVWMQSRKAASLQPAQHTDDDEGTQKTD